MNYLALPIKLNLARLARIDSSFFFAFSAFFAVNINLLPHQVPGRAGLGVESFPGLVPNADRETGVERDRLSLHECRDLPLFLFHHGQQGDLLLARIIAGDAVVRLFFLGNFLGDRQRIDIDRAGSCGKKLPQFAYCGPSHGRVRAR